MKKISISTDNSKFYRQLLEILRSVPPINKLRPKELAVLAEIMLQNNKYRELDYETRYSILFSTKMRKKMRENIKLGEESFNNNLSLLRKYGIISKDNELNRFFDEVEFSDKYSLEFIFKSND